MRKKINTHFINHTTPVLTTPDDGLVYWREKVLLRIIYSLFFLALVAYIPSVILSAIQHLWSIILIDTIVYIIIGYLYFSKSLSFYVRAVTLLAASYLLGVFLIILVGPYGAGYLWLFILPILAGALLGNKSSVIFMIVNIVTLIIIGFLLEYSVFKIDSYFTFSVGSWIVITANFIFLNIIVSATVLIIIQGIENSLENEIIISKSLERQNEEIIIAKEKAEIADRLKSEFLAQTSHEIRTPINTILCFTGLIEESMKHKNDKDLDESFSIISNAGKRLIRTIDLILNMSEMNTDSYIPINKYLDLCNDVLSRILPEFRISADKKGVHLSLSDCSKVSMVFGDEYTISQIFANLIDNAIKYTDKGSIIIDLQNNTDKINVTISDTGIGISDDYMRQIFTPFSQEDKGYTRKYEGNGLGLSLVKKYCELNNIALNIYSQKGKGTTVQLTFQTVN